MILSRRLFKPPARTRRVSTRGRAKSIDDDDDDDDSVVAIFQAKKREN